MSLSLLLLPAVFLLILHCPSPSSAYTPIRCSPATYADPYPAVPPQVVTSATAHFYAVSSPALASVSLHTTNPSAYNSTASSSYTSVPSPCFNGTVAGVTASFSPIYGRAIDLQADVLAVGAPSRGATDASFIELVSLSLSASGSLVTASQSIYSSAPTLGLALSLSSDAQYLAAYYDADQLVVYHPVLDRSQPQLSTGDVLVPYPSAFYVDSMQLSLPYLLVTGAEADAGAAMLPTLLVYEGVGWPGTITAWISNSTRTLSDSAAALPLSYPARALPVSASVLADNSAVVAVGCPSQQTVYVTRTSSTVVGALGNDPTNSALTSFGAAVALSADGQTAFVLAAEGMLVFSTEALLASNDTAVANAVAAAESVLPNRQQHLDAWYSSYSSLAVSNNLTLVLPSASTTPLLVPFVSASVAFDSATDTFIACPAGSYRPVTTTASLSPCLFCPVGTYSSTTGSSACTNCTDEEYCPAGSTYPYAADSISESPESTIPEFETESFEESFEDLLINGIFSPTTVPMLIAFVIAGVTLVAVVLYVAWKASRLVMGKVLGLYRFALMPDEEEEREKEMEVKWLVDELLEERDKKAPRCPHAVVPNTPQRSRRPSALVAAAQRDEQKQEGEGPRAAMKKASEEAASVSNAMKGFFNVLLVLFACSCIVFSWTYLNNYNPEETATDEHNNRYRTESLYSVTISNPVQLEGLDAINSVNATIYTHLVGYSGMACERASVQQLALDGCIIQQTNALCNQSTFYDVYESEELPNTCTIEFRLVQGTLLSLLATLRLYLPSSLQVQALRYVFQQDAQNSAPQDHIQTGTTTFWDTATHPTDANGELLPNALASYVQRDWVFGILAQSQQIDEQNPPTFAYEWYNTVTSLNTNWLPTAPLSDYTHTQAPHTQLVLTMQTETFFRLQQTQKLIQMKAAFLTILLGLIAIFHIIEFAKQMFELLLLLVKKVRKNQALAKVGQVTQARLNQVVDAGMAVGNQALQFATSSPLTLGRKVGGGGGGGSGGREEREEKQPLSGRSSPSGMMHSSRYIDTPPPPPVNPHYNADVNNVTVSTPSAYPVVSYAASPLPPISPHAQMPFHPAPSFPSYPPSEYGSNAYSALPASHLPYPISSVPLASSGHSRHASYNAGAAVGLNVSSSGSSGGAAGGSKFEI